MAHFSPIFHALSSELNLLLDRSFPLNINMPLAVEFSCVNNIL